MDKFTDIEIDGIDTKDYPDFCDAYVAKAWNMTKSREATEDECLELSQNSGLVNEIIHNEQLYL